MFDDASPHDRIITATLKLAADHDWRDIDLHKIAQAADTGLLEIRTHFRTPVGILKAFSAAVDREVLRRVASGGDETGVARDRLFDVLMTRFEVLQPWKPALKRLSRDAGLALEMTPVALGAQRWMLEAAGISTGGSKGQARTLGASAIYARVVRTWLDDDDPGMAKTMAALDSRLRRGEKTLQRVDDACELISGFAKIVCSALRRTPAASNAKSKTTESPEPA